MTKISIVIGVKGGVAECIACDVDAQVVKDRYLKLRDEEDGGGYEEIQLLRKVHPESRAAFDISSGTPEPKHKPRRRKYSAASPQI